MWKPLLACLILCGLVHEVSAQDTTKFDLPLPTSLGQPVPFPGHTPEMVAKFLELGSRGGLPETIGNYMLLAPEMALDLLFDGLHAAIGHPSGESQTITEKVLLFQRSGNQGHLCSEFTTHLLDRESRFFAGIGNTYLVDMQIEDGKAAVDQQQLIVEQRKVLWDVMKKTYFSKYNFKGEEHVRDDAFYVTEWQGVDFLALPPFIALYLYYRGLDKRMTQSSIQFRLDLQPISRFIGGGDVPGGLMIDIRPRGWPIGIVASTGWYEKSFEFEFIGIGTSLEAVKAAIVQQRDSYPQQHH